MNSSNSSSLVSSNSSSSLSLVQHVLSFCEANKEKNSDHRDCPIQDDDLLWFFLSLFVIIVWGALVRTLLRLTGLHVPYTVLLMVTGLLLGIGTHIPQPGVCSFWSKFTKIARIPPKNILYTFLPVLIFESAYNMDVHVFMRSLSQILVIALPGMVLSVFLTGFVCNGFMTTYGWDYPTSFMYGSIIGATDPVAVVAILKELGTSKKLGTLIEGESLLNDGVAVLMFEIFSKIVAQEEHIILEIVLTLLKIGIGGPLFGFVVGKICTLCLAMIFNDAATEITITVFSSYLTYAVAEELGISGVISVVVLGLKLSADSTSISPEVQKNVHQFWEMVGYLANTVLFVLVGVILSETAIGQIDGLDWFNLAFLYVNLNILRLATLMLLMPWLTRIGYGLKWQDMLVCMWGGLRGAVGLCLALEVFYNAELCAKPGDTIGPKFLFHTGGIVFLTLFVNGTTTKAVLDTLHLTDVSSGRLQDMNNAVKQVVATKARAVLQYRHNASVADADWKIVQKNTKIHDPYKVNHSKPRSKKVKPKKSYFTTDSDSSTTADNISLERVNYKSFRTDVNVEDGDPYASDNTMPGSSYKATGRPGVEDDDTEDESKKSDYSMDIGLEREIIEAEESRQRIIKALKVSFWRQYEKGVLSDLAVQILIGVADRAGDLQLHMIHAKDFERYYVVHGFFHWFQKKVVEKLGLDKPYVLPPKPKAKWRRCLWWLATREWFTGIITIIVLLSMIPAIWEFVLEVKGTADMSQTQRTAFLITSIIFTCIYLLEFLIKIFGFGFIGYFKDKWNWVDSLILILGIINVSFTIGYVFSVVGQLGNTATSGLSLIRVLRVLKIFRSLRLLKCCVGRSRGFLDTRMNYSIFLGYDIGTGFVKAVDDVIKFLPQMTEHERVLRQLERALRTERLETIRLLGLLQQKHPMIATAVKTRHASRFVLNEMRETLHELREDGLLDLSEGGVLQQVIESKMKGLWSTPVTISPNSPQTILQNILWLHGGDDIALTNYMMTHADLLDLDEGDTICNIGDPPNGIYLIVEGMVKVHYISNFEIMQDQLHSGKLPNVEVLGDMTFRYDDTDYVQIGYAIGEVGVLTGLDCSSSATCETPVRVYHISQEAMTAALEIFNTSADGLESRIWRSVGMRIAVSLLPAEPEYQSWTVDRIRYHVEQSAVPIGAKFENMTLPEYICDVVLLQGEIQDGNTRELFTAPRLLPRSCKKLSKVLDFPLPVRFLLIAEDEIDDIESDDSDSGSTKSDSGVRKSVHKLVVKASHISSDTSIEEAQAQAIPVSSKNLRQRTLLKKLQLHWH